jgi:hypothetical protein
MRNLLSKKKRVPLVFPISGIELWKDLKRDYQKYGYEWSEVDIISNPKQLKGMDRRNRKKFLSLKKNETTLRNSVVDVLVPFIIPPPSPSNYERFRILERWNKNNNSFNICMCAIELYKKYGMEPCKDYEPDKVIEIYYTKKKSSRSQLPPETTAPPPEPTAPPSDPEDNNELRTVHLRETGYLFTGIPSILPNYTES